MPDPRWRRDPMGRPYDPYRGFDERGRQIPDQSGYDRNSDRRGASDPGYRPDEQHQRDHATDQFRSRDGGHLGEWDWQHARRGEVEGDYGRGYGNRENGPYHRDNQYGSGREPPRRRPDPRDAPPEEWNRLRRDRDRGWPGG